MIWRIFKIIRIPNLFIIVLIEYILHQKILLKLFSIGQVNPELDQQQFYTIVLFSILLTLSGYIINDFYDVKIDQLNKPNQNWVILIGQRNSIILYSFLSLICIILSITLALQLNKLEYLWITPMMILLLWAYSRYFKFTMLIGNIWVGVFCMLVILLIWMSEEKAIHTLAQTGFTIEFYQAFAIFSYYGIFAFIITICRELVKDVEDMDGDRYLDAKTFPIIKGVKATKQFLWILIILINILIINVLCLFISFITLWQMLYVIILISLPLIVTSYLVFKAKSPKDFGTISNLIKCIMISGTILLLSFPI